MSTYRLRFRFHVSKRGVITGENKDYLFTLPNGRPVSMHCIDGGNFSDSTKFSILSGGYPTKEEAIEYAAKIKDSVLFFGAKFRLGVDVGNEKARGYLSKYVKDKFFEQHGVRMIDDVHGITVYSEDYPTSCMSISAAGVENPREVSFFSNEICNILSVPNRVNSQIKLAMEVFTSSFFESSPRARFLTLVLSAESILSLEDRSPEVKKLIDELKDYINASNIKDNDKSSVLGSLNSLYKDSISQSLRKMAAKYLQDKVYDGLPSQEFITQCYEARRELIHTGNIEDSKYNLGTLAADLEIYMTDMLTAISWA